MNNIKKQYKPIEARKFRRKSNLLNMWNDFAYSKILPKVLLVWFLSGIIGTSLWANYTDNLPRDGWWSYMPLWLKILVAGIPGTVFIMFFIFIVSLFINPSTSFRKEEESIMTDPSYAGIEGNVYYNESDKKER